MLGRDAAPAQDVEPAARLRIRVADRGDHAPHPGGEDRVGARWGLAVVGTGLEGDDERRTARGLSRSGERVHLGVGAAVFFVEALADDGAVLQNHGAHQRIRRDAPPTPPREIEGASHGLGFGAALRG